MDGVAAAERDIGLFNAGAQFDLARARVQIVAQRGHAEIGEIGADAQPVEFFRRFDLAELDIGFVQILRGPERLAQRGMLRERQRADESNSIALRLALREHADRRFDRRRAAPGDVRVARNVRSKFGMIDVLHEHRVPHVRREHADRLGRHRPAGQPLHHRPEAVSAAKDEVVAAGLLHHPLDRHAPPAHFRVGKARVLRFGERLQCGGQRRDGEHGRSGHSRRKSRLWRHNLEPRRRRL